MVKNWSNIFSRVSEFKKELYLPLIYSLDKVVNISKFKEKEILVGYRNRTAMYGVMEVKITKSLDENKVIFVEYYEVSHNSRPENCLLNFANGRVIGDFYTSSFLSARKLRPQTNIDPTFFV